MHCLVQFKNEGVLNINAIRNNCGSGSIHVDLVSNIQGVREYITKDDKKTAKAGTFRANFAMHPDDKKYADP